MTLGTFFPRILLLMADKANSLHKSKFIKRYGPQTVGFGFKASDSNTSKNDRLWTNIDGTERPMSLDGTIALTTTRTLLAKESGSKVMLNSATAFTTTLPPVAEGLEFWIFVLIAASATGHTVAINSADTTAKMYGKVSPTGAATAATNAKGRTNTQATSVVGDGLHVWCNGTHWFADPTGTWAEAA